MHCEGLILTYLPEIAADLGCSTPLMQAVQLPSVLPFF